MSDKMMAVPELSDPRIVDSRFHDSSGWKPVGGKDRLPDNENVNPFGWLLIQYAFDGGNSAQANRSSGRDKKDEADFRGIRIEAARKFPDVGCVQRSNGQAAGIGNVKTGKD